MQGEDEGECSRPTTVECQTMLSLNDIIKLENASEKVQGLKCTCEELKLKCTQLETTAAVCLKKNKEANDKLKTYVMNEDTLKDDNEKI